MSLLHDKISPLIESQFPSFYRDEGPLFVQFVKEYYTWLENSGNALYHSRHLLDYRDIDQTLDQFLPHFQNKYLVGTPTNTTQNQRDLIKHSHDLYQTKGTIESLRLIFQMLFNEQIQVYYPGDDILRASDGDWVAPKYLELSISPRTAAFIGRDVQGSVSGARAFIERVDRRTYKGRVVDIAYLSNVRINDATGSDFIYGELISNDGIIAGAPQVVGSLTRIGITSAGAGFVEGQVIDVISTRRGVEGKARVVSTGKRTGEVNYLLVDGGYGYTTSANVYLSANVLSLAAFTSSNSFNTNFPEFSTVIQPLANVAFNLANVTFTTGSLVYGVNSAAGVVTSGIIMAVNEYANTGWVLLSPRNTAKLSIDTILTANTVTGSFAVGETVYQTNTSGNSAVGSIISANSTYITIDQKYGPFVANSTVRGVASSARANAVSVATYAYESNNFNNTSITSIILADTTSGAHVTGVDNLTATGNVVGSNAAAVGVINVTKTFYGGTGSWLYNTSTPATAEILVTSSGSPGGFKIGAVTGTENVVLSTDIISGGSSIAFAVPLTTVAIADVNGRFTCANTNSLTAGKYLTISGTYGGTGSIVGYTSPTTYKIASVANTTTFTLQTIGGQPISTTMGTPTGLSYKQCYLNLPLNSTAYGFPASASANLSSVIGTVFTNNTYTIGTILSLTERNPGFNNTAKPFAIEIEQIIATYNKRGVVTCGLSGITGNYNVGETVTQNIPQQIATLTVSNTHNSFTPNSRELIKQVRSDGVTVYGQLYTMAIVANTGTLSCYVANTSNTFDTSNNIVGLASGANATITLVTAGTVNAIARAVVTSASNTSVTLKRKTFQNLIVGASLYGSDTGTTANVVTLQEDSSSGILGHNAFVDPLAGIADGTINEVEVVNSGVFYENGETVALQIANNQSTGYGIAYTEHTGVEQGYWRGERGVLDSTTRVQDNEYYQEYSYEIQSGVDRTLYEKAVKSITHVAGTKMFSKYVNNIVATEVIDSAPSTFNKIFTINLANTAGSFSAGQVIYQTANNYPDPANTSATGIVGSYNSTLNTIQVNNITGTFAVGRKIFTPSNSTPQAVSASFNVTII